MMRTFTVLEVGEFLKVSPDKVLSWIHAGEMTAINVATRGSRKPRFRITNDALQAFLHGRSTTTPPASERRTRRARGTIPQYV